MAPSSPLQQLFDLDKSSPRFHDQLRDIIGGKEYRERIPHLRDNDLVRLVEYLDGVSPQIALLRSSFNVAAGSRLPGSYVSRIPDALT